MYLEGYKQLKVIEIELYIWVYIYINQRIMYIKSLIKEKKDNEL